ncbi:aminotransferase class I/II-fold pyridoxal phosphate-dependent enzyme [Bacillus mangrovi]|uniref:Aminotransferase class I/II-fold pyridoxal phosphate-dependent enzyme n=1 Tax=Metabacillus mangrovi TaxID=1491830 RepID=A0A7X2S603_9BACI|nr:pyridoxal phosphate-dependent aminotransferase [Metabacillus mangrovi]MTH54289.1 aminotransferase class I/II-fold pyridoxal phosphate-dependent enzyme [Metabacillus mangrovi]
MTHFEPSRLLSRLPEQFFAALSLKAAQKVQEGHDIINLGQGNPDQPTPPHIIKALQEAAEQPENHKYSPFRGKASLKEAAAAFYKREYGVTLDPETEIAVLFGGKAGLVELPQCLLNPGETALVPDPGYPDYWSGVEMAGANMHLMPLLEENHYLPDYRQLDRAVLDRSKLMFLNYPNNPTGAAASKAFFEETVEFAKAHHICTVHDFAYGAIGFDGEKPVSFLQTPGAKDVGIEIYTLSKTFNMAGWRVGFAAGNPSVIEALNLFQDHMYVSVFGAVQDAAAAALLDEGESVRRLSEMYENRRNVLVQSFKEIGWELKAPKGSFFAWLPVPKGYTSQEFSDLLLEKAHVVMAPGSGFGQYGEGYLRTALLTDETRIQEAAERISKLGIFTASAN